MLATQIAESSLEGGGLILSIKDMYNLSLDILKKNQQHQEKHPNEICPPMKHLWHGHKNDPN